MCGIVGFSFDNVNEKLSHRKTIRDMRTSIKHRGNDQWGEYIGESVALGHARLSIRDIENGNQPMIENINGKEIAIVYNGEIYNSDAIKLKLKKKGYLFKTTCDTEVILKAYIEYGLDCIDMLNGIFAFAIYDSIKEQLLLVRDRVGVKPLFYAIRENNLIFASELKALLTHPLIEAKLDMDGFREIFGTGPARTPGNGVFKDVYELKAGHYGIFKNNKFVIDKYWDIPAKVHTDSYDDTIDMVKYLVSDSIKGQMVSDVEVCTFLSGGLDSTIVTDVASRYMLEKGRVLNTFSFDFKGNDKNFVSNSFQPERDESYVKLALENIKANHKYLWCDDECLFESLFDSVRAKDLPGMADVDASLLYFCKEVKKNNTVALTGECADEIFGGYPWFYREDLLKGYGFPWSKNVEVRECLLQDSFVKELDLRSYINTRYEESIKEVPMTGYEDLDERARRQIGYLNIKWFMQTLLDRMDRASMYSGLEARVPFADHRIIEYVFNVPWHMKYKDGVEKSLLREAFRGNLTDKLLYRKKSPYPKTYSPIYEKLLKEEILKILEDSNSPIHIFADKNKIKKFVLEPSQYGKPWFGQLMASAQLLAYFIEIDYWISNYKINVV